MNKISPLPTDEQIWIHALEVFGFPTGNIQYDLGAKWMRSKAKPYEDAYPKLLEALNEDFELIKDVLTLEIPNWMERYLILRMSKIESLLKDLNELP